MKRRAALPHGNIRRLIAAGAAVIAAAWTFAPNLAFADDDEDVEALLDEPIVETASRGAESANSAPATSTVITAEQLRRFGIRSVDEALNYLSLGMTTSRPLHAVEVGARGVALTVDYGNHVLLLVDGHRMNEPWNGTAYFERGTGIPLELIDRIEVVLGPGSVLYGSQAMLGVVHIVTKRAKHYKGLHLIAEGGFTPPLDVNSELRGFGSSGYWSDAGKDYKLALGFGREFKLFGSPAELVIQAEYYRQVGPVFEFRAQDYGEDSVTGEPKNFGPRTPRGVWGGRAEDSYFTEVPSAYGRLYWGEWTLSSRAAMYQRGTPYLDGVVQDAGNFDDPDNRERDRWLNLDLARRFALSVSTTVDARLYADFYDYSWFNRSSAAEDCLGGQDQGCDRELVGEARVLGAELQTAYDWDSGRRNSSLFGLDVSLRHIDSTTQFQDLQTGQTGAVGTFQEDSPTLAAYVQHTAVVLEPLTVNAGLRGDLDERFGLAVSPRVAAVVTPWADAAFKLIYSEAFRAPSAYERAYSDPTSDLANLELDPETVRSVEASIEQRFGRHRVFFGAFRSWWSDMILYEEISEDELNAAIASGLIAPNTDSAGQYRNLSSIDNWGLNAAYEGALFEDRLRFATTLTSAFTRQASAGVESRLPTVGPQVFGNARVSFTPALELPTFAVALHYEGRRLVDQYYDGEFPTRPTLDRALRLRGTVSGDVPGVETLEYRVGVDYSFSKYSPYAVGANVYGSDRDADLAPMPRLSAFAGLHYRFDP